MNILNKHIGVVVAAFLMSIISFANATYAQENTASEQEQVKTDFTDAELEQFANANTRLMVVQKESEKKILTVLEEEKLSIEKFNEMARAYQQQTLNEVAATDEEKAGFNKAVKIIMEMQPTMEKDIEDAIQKDGMTLEQYEQIMLAYQHSPTVQSKVNQLMGVQ